MTPRDDRDPAASPPDQSTTTSDATAMSSTLPTIQTTTTDDQITATTETVTLTVPSAVVQQYRDDALDQHVRSLLSALLATHHSDHVSCGLPEGDVTLRAGEAFASTPLEDIRVLVGELVASVLEVYFHLELDAGEPEHYAGMDEDQVAVTDGGQR